MPESKSESALNNAPEVSKVLSAYEFWLQWSNDQQSLPVFQRGSQFDYAEKFAEYVAADLREKLSTAERETNCEKLKRERETKRHWQGRAEAAEAELARVYKLIESHPCACMSRSDPEWHSDRCIKTLTAALRTGGEPKAAADDSQDNQTP